jgi:ribA/ribD-fused uncharacterized protein
MVSGSLARKRRTQRKQRKLRKQRKQRTQRNKQYGGALTENDHIFFWEAYEIPYGFLSNFYTRENEDGNHCQASSKEIFDKYYNPDRVIRFKHKGKNFANSEQAFCYEKVINLGYGLDVQKVITDTENPYIIKDIGSGKELILNGVSIGENADWSKWGAANGPLMYNILMAKFRPTPGDRDMFDRLDATGEAQLIEASPDDRRWGIGYDAAHALMNKANWGENKLGNLLMKVRKDLRGEQTNFNGANNARGNDNNDGDAF